MSSQPTAAKIFTLPPELVEQSLIIAALGGFPSAVACLGQTCRHFYSLIYCSSDNHLWRGIFLTTFDDPRLVLGRLRGATAFGPMGNPGRDVEISFDWAGEFMRRLDAARLLRRYYGVPPGAADLASKETQSSTPLSRALRSFLSVLETATPFPAHRGLDPSLQLTPTFPAAISLEASPLPFPPEFKSRSTAWMERTLRNGYPPPLTTRFLFDLRPRGIYPRHNPPDSEEWTNTEEGRLFHKLVFVKSFIPVPPNAQEKDMFESCPRPTKSGASSSHSVQASDESSNDQMVLARDKARRKVYDLRYPTPERCWGPFLPVRPPAVDTRASVRKTVEVKIATGANDPPSELIEITGDRDSLSGTNIPVTGGDSDDEDISDDGFLAELEHDALELTFRDQHGHNRQTFVPPLAHQLVPDYGYLAAARLLVEMNLREVLGLDDDAEVDENSVDASVNRVVDAFACLNLMRMGGAPGFWNECWVAPEDLTEQDGAPSLSTKTRGKTKVFDQVRGWDWAGVTGEWKRSVCWLDYHDLRLLNRNGLSRSDLEETMRIFPMTLRVSGYSKPPEPDPGLPPSSRSDLESLVWKLPVIHVEGESKGSDVDAYVRQVRGTVRMIGDGAVRWSLMSSHPGEDIPEWITEGVQIGSIGSIVGILGMWTGADHFTTDPLGPVWAWKVV